MTEVEWLASDDPGRMLGYMDVSALDARWVNHPGSKWMNRKLRLFAAACCRQVWHLLTDDAPCPDCWRNAVWKPLKCRTCGGTGRVNRSRRAVEVAEWFADGEVNEAIRSSEHQRVWNVGHGASNVLVGDDVLRKMPPGRPNPWGRLLEDCGTPAVQAAILRDLVGNPFRPVRLSSRSNCRKGCRRPPDRANDFLPRVCPDCGNYWECPWLTPTVIGIARAIYNERTQDHPILADALEDAGCTDEAILRHLRGWESEPGRWLKCRRCKVVYAYTNKYSNCESPGCEYEPYDGVVKWRSLRGPHVRGCWVVDLMLGKEGRREST